MQLINQLKISLKPHCSYLTHLFNFKLSAWRSNKIKQQWMNCACTQLQLGWHSLKSISYSFQLHFIHHVCRTTCYCSGSAWKSGCNYCSLCWVLLHWSHFRLGDSRLMDDGAYTVPYECRQMSQSRSAPAWLAAYSLPTVYFLNCDLLMVFLLLVL